MNLTTIKKLPSAEEIINAFPLSLEGHARIARDREEVKAILSGSDHRMLVVVGPCSAWPYESVIEYAKRLKSVSDQIQDRVKVVLRLYIQKPRTTKGWTGPVNQPDPFLPPDIEKGIAYSRSLMVRAVEMGLPIADEAVFTHNARGFIELLSWVAIGARSTEDQEHRIFASAVECAVGMKNPTSGNLEIGVNGIIAAQHGHTTVFNGYQVETRGNDFAHLVLRGGNSAPNYDQENIAKAVGILEKANVKNPAILIDASHDNCKINGKKEYARQMTVVCETMELMNREKEFKKYVKGFMIESFLTGGSQSVARCTSETINRNGLSITDPCLSWEQTEETLIELGRS
ncbi:3-deoxy-7-phosphoheptulonate synthase [Candidatus Uhrbacteria bacterium]|nr:3-deoxy-7-phosphoheptulonate synthase [Candidatus Uhrbacteria bacterium]